MKQPGSEAEVVDVDRLRSSRDEVPEIDGKVTGSLGTGGAPCRILAGPLPLAGERAHPVQQFSRQ